MPHASKTSYLIHRKLLSAGISAVLTITPILASATPAESSVAELRLSFPLGEKNKSVDPWLGLSVSQHSELTPWQKVDRPEESSVNFSLSEPQMALTSLGKRTVFSWVKPAGTAVRVGGCGGAEPTSGHETTQHIAAAVGGAAVVGFVTYLLLDDGLATGC